MNKINRLFSERGDRKLLSLYFCAGCPEEDMTADVILAMQRHGIDMIEVGIPFSDPLADGPVIQSAGTVALKNGMTLETLFGQLASIKSQVNIPLVLMGYLNVIMHYGYERFCQRCVEYGVSGFIIPDLPFDDYLNEIKPLADRYNLRCIMMITPETSEERIRFIDRHTDGFIYMVSSASITGAQQNFDEAKQQSFQRRDIFCNGGGTGLLCLQCALDGHHALDDEGTLCQLHDLGQLLHALAAGGRGHVLQERQTRCIHVHGHGKGTAFFHQVHFLPDQLQIPGLHRGHAQTLYGTNRPGGLDHDVGIQSVAGKGRNARLGAAADQGGIVGFVVILIAVVHGHSPYGTGKQGRGKGLPKEGAAGIRLAVGAQGIHIHPDRFKTYNVIPLTGKSRR